MPRRTDAGATASICTATALALLLMPAYASAQELEPGAYWPIPTGLNIVTVVNSFNWGDLAFDPSAPIDEASATINTTAFAFTRAFSLAGRSANAGVVLPVVGGHLEGLYLGEPARGRPVRAGRSEAETGDEPVWGSRDDAEGVCVVPPGHASLASASPWRRRSDNTIRRS